MYVEVLDEVREAKYKQSRKTPRDYQILKRYDLVKVGRCEKLFFPVMEDSSSFKYYVSLQLNT
jgi:hypothetical protein